MKTSDRRGVTRMSVTYIDDTGRLWIIGLGQIRQFCSAEKYDQLVLVLASSIDEVVEKRSKA